ncbi:hypothetical protein AB6C94_25155 [Vibrio splendidus]
MNTRIVLLPLVILVSACSSNGTPKEHYTYKILEDGVITPLEYAQMNLWDQAKYKDMYHSPVNQVAIHDTYNN